MLFEFVVVGAVIVGAIPRHEGDGVDGDDRKGRCRSGEHAGGRKLTGASLHLMLLNGEGVRLSWRLRTCTWSLATSEGITLMLPVFR